MYTYHISYKLLVVYIFISIDVHTLLLEYSPSDIPCAIMYFVRIE